MAHYLYLDINRIQNFVFASPKLKDIRGGSALLDRFNRIRMVDLASQVGGQPIFLAGGKGLLRLPSRQDAEALGRQLERELRKATEDQVSMSWAWAEDNGDWAATFQLLETKLQKMSLLRPPAAPPLPPFVALCGACGLSPAQSFDETEEYRPRPLCQTCRRRHDEARDSPIWHRLKQYLGPIPSFAAAIPDREFEVLASQGSGGKYLAYLYCDGNQMGRLLGTIRSEKEYKKESNRIDEALHKATATALREHCPPNGDETQFCAEVLLLGGDDLIAVMPADRAAGFTSTLLRTFYREANRQVTLSAGLVFSRYDMPITLLQQAAQALLLSAKKRAYLDEMRVRYKRRTLFKESFSKAGGPLPPAAEGYVDFQEITSSQIEIEREQAVTCRPYRLDEFDELVNRVSVAKSLPRSRLYALAEALSGSQRQAFSTAQLIVGRTRGDDAERSLRALLYPPCVREVPQQVLPYTQNAAGPHCASEDLPLDLYSDEHRYSPLPDALELIDHIRQVRPEPRTLVPTGDRP